jgi:signal peptidase II
MLRRAPTAARPLGRARHAREQARPGAAGWTGMLALAVAALAADQLTKATVVHALRVNEAVDVLPGLSFWHVRNTGIAFGVFTGRLSFVVLLTVAAVIWMLAFFARSGARHPLVPVAIGLLLGGSVSNLWDRAYNNFVTDFIYIRLLPNFNLADSFIVSGVAILIFTLVRGEPADHNDGTPWDAS